MHINKVVNKILDNKPEARRNLGRPRLRRLEDVKKSVVQLTAWLPWELKDTNLVIVTPLCDPAPWSRD